MLTVLGWDGLQRRTTVTASSTPSAYPARNVLDGNLHTLTRSSGTGGVWDLIFDLGASATAEADHVVLGGVVGLTAVGATIEWSDSPDAVVYTARLSPAAATSLAPESRHYAGTYTSPGPRRAWRLRCTAGVGAPYQIATVDFGLRLELERNPALPTTLAPHRAHLGGEYVFTLPHYTTTGRDAVLAYLAAVAPDYPAPGLPHWIYDPDGLAWLAAAGVPVLVPVTLLTPQVDAPWEAYTTFPDLRYRRRV